MDSSDEYYYSYEEEFPEYDVQYSMEPPSEIGMTDEQLYNCLDNEESTHFETNSPPPQIPDNDPSVAISTSINQSRELLQQVTGLPISAFRAHHVPGIIILRLEDISTIRNETRRNIQIPHLIYFANPSDNNPNHPELDYITALLNHPRE